MLSPCELRVMRVAVIVAYALFAYMTWLRFGGAL
jgi:hypothetical protein